MARRVQKTQKSDITTTLEGKECPISWEGCGLLVLVCRGCQWSIFQKERKIYGSYNALLRQLQDEIKTTRRDKLRKGVLFRQDNVPLHISVVLATYHECGFELLEHPQFSRSGSVRRPSVLKHEESSNWNPFEFGQWGHSSCGELYKTEINPSYIVGKCVSMLKGVHFDVLRSSLSGFRTY